MYGRVFGLLSQGSNPDQAVAQRIFMWTTFSYRQLTATELLSTFKARFLKRHDNDDDFTDFDRTVISTCASLVEKAQMYDATSGSMQPYYRLIHLSVSEFLKSHLCKQARWFLLSESDSHLTMARSSLQYLSFHGPNQPRHTVVSGSQSHDKFEELYPFCAYAMSFWTEHLLYRNTAAETLETHISSNRTAEYSQAPLQTVLQEARKAGSSVSTVTPQIFSDFVSTLSLFLSQKSTLLAYIDIMYHIGVAGKTHFNGFRDCSAWVAAMAKLPAFRDEKDTSSTAFRDACDFASYLEVLDEQWGRKLRERPCLIWDEVTAFTHCRLLEQTKSTQVLSLSSNAFKSQGTSSRCLCKVSEVSNDQKHIGILSIWPSKKYEEISSHFFSYVLSVGSVYFSTFDWIARYEIWTLTGVPKRIVDARISLQSEDIWQQYRYSLHNQMYGFKLQFPISVSPCIDKFAVLQNIYFVQVNENASGVKIVTSTLPFSFDDVLAPLWSQERLDRSWLGRDFDDWRITQDYLMYSLVFGPITDLVFFIGKNSTTSSIYLAVFDLSKLDELSISLAGPSKIFVDPTGTTQKPLENTHRMHPKLPLVAFASGGHLYLWAYGADNIVSQESPILNAYPLVNMASEACLWYCAHLTHFNGDFNFSEDGKYIVIGSCSSPTIIPLPDNVLATCTHGRRPAFPAAALTKSGPSSSVSEKPRFPSFSDFSDCLIRSSAYSVAPSGVRAGVAATTSNEKIELQLYGPVNGCKSYANVEVTTLPDNWSLSNVSTSFQLPKTKDEMIRIILNQAAQPWYSLSDGVNEYLPAVIDRAVGSIRTASGRVGGGNPTIFLLEDQEPPAKRSRRQ